MRQRRVVALLITAGLVLAACSDASSSPGRLASTTTSTGPERAAPLIPPAFLEGSGGSDDLFSFTESLESGLGDLTTVFSPEDLALIAAGPGALDYLGLYEDVQEASYSVGYRVKGELVESIPGAVAFSIVHDPTHLKNTASADDTVAAMVVQDASSTTVCAKFGTWSCEPGEPGTEIYGAETLLLLLGVVAETPGAFDIARATSTVVGVPVSCLTATPVSSEFAPAGFTSPIEVCVTGEGVPLRVSVPSLELEGVWYRPSADPSEFDLPA